ncbi:MAG TPA: hypothetical protein PLS03_15070 [Terrimicrobiaceae bacterium]|nr:hypothetical protein [Terrimicrobiaceae bacterium]
MKRFPQLVLAALILLRLISPVQAEEPSPLVQKMFQNLMNAVQAGDHAAMILDGDETFRQGLTPAMTAGVSAQLAPRMREGYSAAFLTRMRQASYDIYLWKLTFQDGGDDFIAKVVLNQDGRVAGFLIN